MQPPILAGNPSDILIASTDEWISLAPEYRGRWRLAYIRPSKDGNELYGDGVHCPKIKPFWIGAKFSGDIYLDAGVRYADKTE